jgi:DNA-binding NtrC family response regulator
MVYGTVKQAGGTTTVSSQLGKGTTFTIRLPAALCEVETTPQERPAIPAKRKGAYTILVAEDDKRVQHTLSIALKGAGYDVFTADNGQQAWEMFQRDHELIDLVITDLLMPELNGTDLSLRMKELCEETRILYISGYPRNSIVEEGILAEDVELMQKPFTHAEILRRIDDMLHGQRLLHA